MSKWITDKCSYCSFSVENIKHLFYQCLVTRRLWSQVKTYFNSKIKIPNLTVESAYLGFVNVCSNDYLFLNHLLLIFKMYVYANRSTKLLIIENFIHKIASIETLERVSINQNKYKSSFHSKKWNAVISLLR